MTRVTYAGVRMPLQFGKMQSGWGTAQRRERQMRNGSLAHRRYQARLPNVYSGEGHREPGQIDCLARLANSIGADSIAVEDQMGKLGWFVAGGVTALTAAAISKELEKPASERTWRGTIAGVPYNFNVPTWAQIAQEYWNQDSNQIVTPHTIGIGWGINFAALLQWIQDTFGEQGHAHLPSGSQPSERIER